MSKVCLNCLKEFERSYRMSFKVWDSIKYCSRKCYFKNFKPHDGNFKKGYKPWCDGKKGQYHHNKEAKVKIKLNFMR